MAAAPANNSVHNTVASVSVTAQHDATTWTKADSVVMTYTDTCDAYIHASGTVTLQPEQTLYVSFAKDAGSLTTAQTYSPPEGARDPLTLVFGNLYVDSLLSQTDRVDTIFLYLAVKGTGTGESVAVSSVYMTGTIIDRN